MEQNDSMESRKRPGLAGRGGDLRKALAALREGRLVTLCGVPGIGKTAAARALVRWMRRRSVPRDGVFVVELRGARSAEALRWMLARAIGASESTDASVSGFLRGRASLLVLERLDDPLSLDREAVLGFLGRLLRQSRRLKILATSSRAIGESVGGAPERAIWLDGLRAPEAARVLGAEGAGVELAPLLERLEGNPLALRLAAPCLRGRGPRELAELLQGPAPGSAVAASVEALGREDAEGALLLGVLGLLPAGGLAEDLDYVWGEGWRSPMERLRRAALVERRGVADTERYTLPPTVLVVAAGILGAEERARIAGRICRHLAAMSVTLARAVDEGGKSAVAAWALFALEELNLWASLKHRGAAAVVALQLPGLLLRAGRPGDALRAAEVGALALREQAGPELQAELLRLIGNLKMRAGDPAGARSACEALLAIHRQAGDFAAEADTLRRLGDLKRDAGDSGAALRDYEMALALHREAGNPLGEAACRESLGRLRLAEDNPGAAAAEFRLALQIHVEARLSAGISADLGLLGTAELAAQRPAQAALLFDEALRRHRQLGDLPGEALDLNAQAEAFWALGSRTGALAAWWLAQGTFRALDMPVAEEIQQMLAGIGEKLGEEDYDELIADLEANAELRRQAAVGLLRRSEAADPVLGQILEGLGH